MENNTENEEIQFSIRLPKSLKAQVAALGKEQKRSMNKQIELCLEECIRRHEQEQKRKG